MKLTRSISMNSLLLGGFAVLTAGLLATVNQVTKGPIADAEKAAAQKALLEILPRETHDNDMLEDTLPLNQNWQSTLNTSVDNVIFRARKNGQIVAVIIPITAPDGYSGDIKMIVGINHDLTLAGTRVLSHSETPGLGDKIELKKSQWILSFNNLSLSNPTPSQWKVTKDGGQFDQFTGATITPRAVVKQVKHALEFARDNHLQLFSDQGEIHEQ